jgi:sulfur transfer complex TusBCD TusB component (DsrH family)
MAIRKLTNAAYLATNWQDEVESKNDLKKGLCVVELDVTNKQIKAGSVIEANGVVYKSDTATSPSNSVSLNYMYYIYFRDIAGTLDFYYSVEKPIFSATKNGWYGSINPTWRAIAKVYLTSSWLFYTYQDDFEKDLVSGTLYSDSFTDASASPTKMTLTSSDDLYDVISNSNNLIATKRGIYLVTVSCNVVGLSANKVVTLQIRKNDIVLPYLKQNVSITQTYNRPFCFSGLVTLDINDTISLWYSHPSYSAGTDVATYQNVNVSLIRVSESYNISTGTLYSDSFTDASASPTKMTLTSSDNLLNVTAASNNLTVTQEGIYLVTASCDAINSLANKAVTLQIRKNDTVLTYMQQEVAVTTMYPRAFGFQGLVSLAANDTISLWYSHPSWVSTTDQATFSNISLNVTKVNQIKNKTTGSLRSASFSSASASPTKMTLTVSDNLSGVSAASNTLTLTQGSQGGTYLVAASCNFVGLSANKVVTLQIRKNDALTTIDQEVVVTTLYNRPFCFSGLVTLDINDTISLWYSHPSYSAGTDVVTFANIDLSLIRVVD